MEIWRFLRCSRISLAFTEVKAFLLSQQQCAFKPETVKFGPHHYILSLSIRVYSLHHLWIHRRISYFPKFPIFAKNYGKVLSIWAKNYCIPYFNGGGGIGVVRSGAGDVSLLESGTVSLGVWCPTMDVSTFESETSTLSRRNDGHQTATRSHIRKEQRSYLKSSSNSHIRTLTAKVSEVICCDWRISSDVMLIEIVMEGWWYLFYIVGRKDGRKHMVR